MTKYELGPGFQKSIRIAARALTFALWALAPVGPCFSLIASDRPTPPPGWRIELVAKSPQIKHPSVVCSAPDGRVFVAEDPMDISAPANAPQGRIICFQSDGSRSIFAENLYAVFGMQYLEGKLYVLHNPKFSVFEDHGQVGADRVDLIESTQPNPWALEWNDHVPANFRLAMDGYFYVAVGDKGIYGAVGRDGKRVDLPGGGILRLRPDGTELEVYCTGVRNILDVAINAEDELFTYDNTDEHDWMGRLTHMVEGGVYGYPHDFIPRRPYTLWMMYDFGAGAATGAFAYNEDALPEEYHGNLFLADFGKRQLTRVVVKRDGATYRVQSHEEFFKDVPDDFRPVGISESADGSSIYICDWQHRDTKENVETGRLWKLTWTGATQPSPKPGWYLPAALGKPFEARDAGLVAGLSHPSCSVRLTAQRRLVDRKASEPLSELLANTNASNLARSHAIWALDAIDGGKSARSNLTLVLSDADLNVRRQAIRQAGLRRAKESAGLLQGALKDSDASIRFQAATALGRIVDTNSVSVLLDGLDETDIFARFASFTALNRIGRAQPVAWPQIAVGLESSKERVREGTSFALRETYDPVLVETLIRILRDKSRDPKTRVTVLRLASALHHQRPAWQGEWGAYHPALAPPQPKSESWAGTPLVLSALRETLDDARPDLRLVAVQGLQEAMDKSAVTRLREQFAKEASVEVRRAILQALAVFEDREAAPLVLALISNPSANVSILSDAIVLAARIGGDKIEPALIEVFRAATIDSAARAKTLEALAELKASAAVPVIAARFNSLDPKMREQAIHALGRIGGADASAMLQRLLTNDVSEIRQKSVTALGNLRDRAAVPALLNAWGVADTRAAALEALARVSDARALEVYLEGLSSANPILREECRKALAPIRDEVLPQLEARAAALKSEVITELRQVYDQDARARRGPLFSVATQTLQASDYERYAVEHDGNPVRGQRLFFNESGVACIKCHAISGAGGTVGPDLTLAGIQFPRATLIESVLYPSKAVREGYQQVIIEIRNGEPLSGIVKSETPETITLIDVSDHLVSVSKKEITKRTTSALSLMPEGLHAALSLQQFADLIAFLESRKIDANTSVTQPAPSDFQALFTTNLGGWRELPPGTKRVDSGMLKKTSRTPEHWRAANSILEHDGVSGDLWTEREFGDFDLQLEWRWPDAPTWEDFPLINSQGLEGDEEGHAATLRVLDAGDSGVLLRGLYKAQANLFCYPVGSGEFWEYRTDPNSTAEQRRAFTPRVSADRPIGDWNQMEIVLKGSRVTVSLNGEEVIHNAELPGIPARGPIGLQHEHGRIQFRNIWIKDVERDTGL